MPNEEIITALKNGIQQGESLQETIQTLINSGYNIQDVQEASNYIGQGVLQQFPQNTPIQNPISQIPPSQQPSKYPSLNQQSPLSPQQNQSTHSTQQSQPPQPRQSQPTQQQPISNHLTKQPNPFPQQPITNQSVKLPLKKQGHTKEIILLLILIFLVGILITTIFFRNDILGYFSG